MVVIIVFDFGGNKCARIGNEIRMQSEMDLNGLEQCDTFTGILNTILGSIQKTSQDKTFGMKSLSARCLLG